MNQSVTALGAEMSPDGGEIRMRYDACVCGCQEEAMDSVHVVSTGTRDAWLFFVDASDGICS